jgi:hypothetical protein
MDLYKYIYIYTPKEWLQVRNWKQSEKHYYTVYVVKLGRSSTKYCNLPVAPRAKQFFIIKSYVSCGDTGKVSSA